MKISNSRNLMTVAIAGGFVVALILVLGTIWSGEMARSDTQQAVRNVSLLYLEELASRREQVVASTLNDYVKDMDVALGLLTSEDLESVQSLQAYQLRMKQIYGLEKFAFVDENGTIYTSRGTRKDIDQYAFDHQTISEPEVSIKNAGGDNIKVVIAMPTDRLPYEGHFLEICFMEIDMSTMLENISLQSSANSTTFCNIYTADGYSLTNTVLGGLASEDNLLSALENADFESGYDIEMVKNDFRDSGTGVVSFTYNNIKESMYYVPVHRTDWMLTYLIRESVISGQIDAISEGIVMRSLFMSVLTAVVLAALFIMMIVQLRKTSKLAIERETSELMQQELEERIALQDELLEQEKQRVRLDSMITAMASDYRSVYYVDLDKDQATCYRSDPNDTETSMGDVFTFSTAFKKYANDYVAENYRQQFLDFIRPENIRKKLSQNAMIAFRYLVRKNGEESYEMLRMADVKNSKEGGDNTIHAVGMGFTNIDEEMRESLSRNQALSDALKIAEEASMAKTAFLSSMSHEIRTPMNAIIGLDTIALQNPDLQADTKDHLEKIGSSARHLLNLINDILDMSRIESGRMTIRKEEFNFREMLTQIDTMIGGQCRDKHINYESRVSDEVEDYYLGDDMKLKQVIINILGNAVKFTPEGGTVTFIVEQTRLFENNASLKFTMKDTGIGMDKEYIPKIFDVFSQEDENRANKFGSTGLGMAITKRIVVMMNGSISVDSIKGEGTTFTVSITLTKSDHEEREEKFDTNNLKVLVIDDDPVDGESARIALEELGITPDVFLNGNDAIEHIKVEIARHEAYDMILVDWKMPEKDGIQVTREIREIVGSDSAVVVLTAYNWDDIEKEALEAGVDDFMAKPLASSNVMSAFKKAKGRRRSTEVESRVSLLAGMRVLVAEDMAINARIMKMLLSTKKIEADVAENGQIAVDMFKEAAPGYYSAVLMDVRMPVLDGLGATKAIRALDREDAKKIPIIAMTANAFDEDVQRSLQAGMNAHLNKPVEQDKLFATLSELTRE